MKTETLEIPLWMIAGFLAYQAGALIASFGCFIVATVIGVSVMYQERKAKKLKGKNQP